MVAIHDASFANTEGHKSQKGHWIAIPNKEMLTDKAQLHRMHMFQWHLEGFSEWFVALSLQRPTSERIQRVVRSTFSAEAYTRVQRPWIL